MKSAAKVFAGRTHVDRGVVKGRGCNMVHGSERPYRRAGDMADVKCHAAEERHGILTNFTEPHEFCLFCL